MKTTRIAAALLGAAVIAGSPNIGYTAEKFDFGKRMYDGHCAVCHGKQGKGDGPYAGMGETRVSDLTTLSKKNNGVFPFNRVYDIIDGREAIKAHGPREMPIWGAYYLSTEHAAKEPYAGYLDVPYNEEAIVRTRILALTEYVQRLQAK
jgi:mono/diheme cytochrome c family protein